MIEPIQSNNTNHNFGKYALLTGAGAAAGACARHFVPTKEEFDTFISSTSVKNRELNRSALKYAGVGGLLVAGIILIKKIFTKQNINAIKQADETFNKYGGAFLDAPAYAVEVMFYDDKTDTSSKNNE